MSHIHIAVLSCILLLYSQVLSAGAQGMPLLPESSADFVFGHDLEFTLVAHNAADVERITLHFRPELSPNSYAVDVPFEAGQTISATYAIAAASMDLPAFREVTYWWELYTGSRVQTVLEQRLTYEDNRVEWETTSNGVVTAHWTGSETDMGSRVLNNVDTALKRLNEIVAVDGIGPIDVYVYPSSADLRGALQLADIEDSLTRQLETDVILVTSVNSQTAAFDLAQSIPYAMAKLVLYRAAGSQFESIPWWLHEGIAVRAQEIRNPRHDQVLAAALDEGQLIPLGRLCEDPLEVGDRALLASAQSASILDFIVVERSPAIISELLATYIGGASCEEGLETVLGATLDEIERDWLADLRPSSSFARFLGTYGIWLVLLAGGTGLAVLLLKTTGARERPR